MRATSSQFTPTTGVTTHQFDVVVHSPLQLPTSRARTPRLSDYARAWLDEIRGSVRANTLEFYRYRLERHVLPRLGNRRLDEIGVDDIVGLINDLRERGYAPQSVTAILTPLSRVLSHAARRSLIPSSPMSRLDRSERPRAWTVAPRILNRVEIGRLLEAASPRHRTLLAVAIFTGLRQSELRGLRWRDIDFSDQVIHVRHALDRRGALGRLKTRHSVRDVALMPALVAALAEHRERSAYAALNDFVFTTRTARPIHWRSISRLALRPALARAGLDAIRWHDLRHTYAALLISGGANVVHVANQLGHGNPHLTLSHYGREFDRMHEAQRTRDTLQEMVGGLI
jgi:integrase